MEPRALWFDTDPYTLSWYINFNWRGKCLTEAPVLPTKEQLIEVYKLPLQFSFEENLISKKAAYSLIPIMVTSFLVEGVECSSMINGVYKLKQASFTSKYGDLWITYTNGVNDMSVNRLIRILLWALAVVVAVAVNQVCPIITIIIIIIQCFK